MRIDLRLLIIFMVLFFAWPAWVWGANCGGATPCSCGDTVTSDYTLTADLVCTNAGDTLTIGGDDITLDLDGYTISGDGTNVLHGITATDRSNITITNGTVTNMKDHIIDIHGGSNITISNLILTGALGVGADGGHDAITLGAGASGPATVSISGCTIGINGTADNITRQGITVILGSTISITNNTIYGGRIGIDIEPNAAQVVDGVTILGNMIDTPANTTAYGGSEYHFGIALNEEAGTIQGTVAVSNNTIDLNDELFGGVGRGFDIRSLEHGTFTISGNAITGSKRGAYFLGPISVPVTFKGNIMTGGATNHQYGILFFGAGTAIAQIDLLYNILLDYTIGIDFNVSATVEADIYNNTIDVDGLQYGIRVGNVAHDADVKNNIFFGTPGAGNVYFQVTGANPTVVADNNCYETAGNYWNWQNYTDINFATWKTNSSQDASALNEDPKFVDAANSDFTLQSTSPCIDAGEDLGATYDDALDPNSSWPDNVITLDQDQYGSGNTYHPVCSRGSSRMGMNPR